MQVVVAEDPAAVRAHTAFDEVHASTALVAVRGNLRAAKELEFWHCR
jgi:hypothetical protein